MARLGTGKTHAQPLSSPTAIHGTQYNYSNRTVKYLVKNSQQHTEINYKSLLTYQVWHVYINCT